MWRILLPPSVFAIALTFGGCLATPVAKSGGPGSLIVPNTNPMALVAAAQSIFPQYGYSIGPADFPNSISFDKPAGGFGKLLYGSYGVTTTIRVKLSMIQLTGTNDYQLRTRVSRVSDAGEAGFEDDTKMMAVWSSQFTPILKQIQAQASGAGSGL